jgi:hypothetical protein
MTGTRHNLLTAKRPGATTKQGITAANFVGLFSSLGWILLSAETLQNFYGYSADQAAA